MSDDCDSEAEHPRNATDGHVFMVRPHFARSGLNCSKRRKQIDADLEVSRLSFPSEGRVQY